MLRHALVALLLCLPPSGLFAADSGLRPRTTTLPAGSALTNMTVVETTHSTQTNVPFTIGVPIQSGQLSASQHITATPSGGRRPEL